MAIARVLRGTAALATVIDGNITHVSKFALLAKFTLATVVPLFANWSIKLRRTA